MRGFLLLGADLLSENKLPACKIYLHAVANAYILNFLIVASDGLSYIP